MPYLGLFFIIIHMEIEIKPFESGELPPIAYLIALFNNNGRNVIRAFGANGWRLHPQALALWKKDHYLVPPIWCKRIEEITEGAVTRKMLRPDIFE